MVFSLQLVARPSPLCSLPITIAAATPTVDRIGSRRYHRRLNSDTTITFSGLGSTIHENAAISLRLSYTSTRKSSLRCSAALSPQLKTTLDKVVTSQKVVLFMKGTRDFPQCGFSNNVVQILKSLNVPFETINILENEMLRQGLKEYSSWPTFPQLYIDGEFFGGCDITVEAYQSGELQEVVEKAICS